MSKAIQVNLVNELNNIKLLAFDIDGTILNDNGEILPSTVSQINELKQKGIKSALVSGRSLKDQISFNKNKIFDYLICDNGSYVFHTELNKIEHWLDITNDLVNEIWNIGINHKVAIGIHTTIGVYKCGSEYAGVDEFPMVVDWISKSYTSLNSIKSAVQNETVTQITFLGCQNDILIFTQTLKERYSNVLEITNGTANMFININAIGATKINAISRICLEIAASHENVLVFGDAMNDISMIDSDCIGIAMGNAVDEIKSKADIITYSNNEDGIAEVLKKIKRSKNE